MNKELSATALNVDVLDGMSLLPPTLAGYPFLGTMAAWSGQKGAILLASDQSSPPYMAEVVNPEWVTFFTPAVALAIDWEELYIAFTDQSGMVQLGSTANGWTDTLALCPAGECSDAPALLFADERLYVAWRSAAGYLTVATVDHQGNVQTFPTGSLISSNPTLASAQGMLYALSGGSSDGTGDSTLRIFGSSDQGATFEELPVMAVQTIGPPSMAVMEGVFHLAWADFAESKLNYAVTSNLVQFTATNYGYFCHGGGPALLGLPEGVTLGWSYGAPPPDPRLHHITLGQLPSSDTEETLPHKETFAKLARVGAPNPCPDPLTIYNPATEKCVPRGGCFGGCVIQSFNLVFGFPVFNPFKYAMCVVSCKSN